MASKDYYQVLGVASDADEKTIREAYRDQALKYHPDRNQDSESSAEKMKAVNEAYAVLSDAQKRREYDFFRQQYGESAAGQFRQNYSQQDIFRNSDIHQIFEELSRAFGLRGFDEIFKDLHGADVRHYQFRGKGPLSGGFAFQFKMRGGRHSRRPPFMLRQCGKMAQALFEKATGMALPLAGKDLYDVIRVDSDLARSGGPYAYFHRWRKKKLVVKVPPGVSAGQQIRLQGMGADGSGGAPAGDLYLQVQFKKPMLERVKDMIGSLKKP